MALFDFPRIHFSGNVDLNVPTLNNSYYFPLSLYDATRSVSYLPPRLYFSSEAIINGVQPSINPAITYDAINGYYYIEVTPINTIEILRAWCMQPLGSDPNGIDALYVPYYEAAGNDLGKLEIGSILGQCPGYWNMYGDMGVYFSDVTVNSVQVFDGNEVHHFNTSCDDVPASVKPFLGAVFDLDSAPGSGIPSATMVETISNQSAYASIFCSNANLYRSDDNSMVLMQGNPTRFSAGIYAAWRVVNWMPAMSGSGRFSACIPLNQLEGGIESPIAAFFTQNKSYDSRPLQGIFVSFTLLEVFENRYDQQYYQNNGTKSNPARTTTAGSIAPWYEGDLKTAVLGRPLIAMGMDPVYKNTNSAPPHTININMTPVVASLKQLGNGTALFSVDMGNSWPELMTPAFVPGKVQPALRGQASFETANLGTLSFQSGAEGNIQFATLALDPAINPRSKVFACGGVFDFLIPDRSLVQSIQENWIQVYLQNDTGISHVLTEAPYMFATDQRGLYANQGDLPTLGYRVDSAQREPCRLRILQRGLPVTTPIPVGMAVYEVPEGGNDPLHGDSSFQWQQLADNDAVALCGAGLQLNNNAMYYFVYDGQYPENQIPNYSVNNAYTVMDTGSFVSLRVHPVKDYSQYTNPAHPEYIPPTFEVVYREVLQLYDAIYPIMSLVHPFTAEVWENGTIAGLVLQRTDPKRWADITYMPRSRELSDSQRSLLVAWAEYVNNKTTAT